MFRRVGSMGSLLCARSNTSRKGNSDLIVSTYKEVATSRHNRAKPRANWSPWYVGKSATARDNSLTALRSPTMGREPDTEKGTELPRIVLIAPSSALKLYACQEDECKQSVEKPQDPHRRFNPSKAHGGTFSRHSTVHHFRGG